MTSKVTEGLSISRVPAENYVGGFSSLQVLTANIDGAVRNETFNDFDISSTKRLLLLSREMGIIKNDQNDLIVMFFEARVFQGVHGNKNLDINTLQEAKSIVENICGNSVSSAYNDTPLSFHCITGFKQGKNTGNRSISLLKKETFIINNNDHDAGMCRNMPILLTRFFKKIVIWERKR